MEKENTVLNERRRAPRVKFNLPIQYKNLRKIGEPPVDSSTKDICEGGIAFKTSEFISLACRLVVEIKLPTTDKPIKAISKVAWIRKSSPGNQYELGNQFLEITKEDKAHILDFVTKAIDTSL